MSKVDMSVLFVFYYKDEEESRKCEIPAREES